jgi:FixJ family two-component response regulator
LTPNKAGQGDYVDKNFVAVVEDHPAVRRAVQRLLESAGYTVKVFASAEELLRHGVGGVGCLVLDISLPGMSGLELQRQLAMTSCPPVIFITALEDSDGHLRALAHKSGAVAFLRKPLDEQELLEGVKRAWSVADC